MDWPTAIGAIGIVATLLVALAALRITRRESALRTRPWVGITGCEYKGGPEHDPYEALTLSFQNVGLLPAHSLEIIDVWVGVQEVVPEGEEPGDINDFFEVEGWPSGTVFPHEPSHEAITFRGERGTRFRAWREAHREVLVRGGAVVSPREKEIPNRVRNLRPFRRGAYR